jgi:hypothetical protein
MSIGKQTAQNGVQTIPFRMDADRLDGNAAHVRIR